MLNVSPETERRVHEFARREGVEAEDALTRLLDKAEVGLSPLQPRQNTSDDEKRAKVLALLSLSREEIKRLNAPSIAQRQAQMDWMKTATREEIEEAGRDWEEFKQSINETRRVNGERILFSETPE